MTHQDPTEQATTVSLTAAQQAIITACGLAPNPAYFVVGEVLELSDGACAHTLARAIAATIAEAETLRVRLHCDPDAPEGQQWSQIVEPAGDHNIPEVTDLSAEADPRRVANAIIDAERTALGEQTRNLAGADLNRYRVLDLGGGHVWAVQLYHHVTVDGYSAYLLTRRCAEHYRAIVEDRQPKTCRFHPLADVVADDEEYRASQAYVEDQEFWARRVGDVDIAPGREDLIGDCDAAMTTVRTIDAQTFTALQEAAKSQSVGWTDVVMAAHAALMRRVTNHNEVTIAMPMMARQTKAALRTPIMAVNMLPLTITFSGQETLVELARTIRGELAEQRPHTRFPGSDVPRATGRPETSTLLHGIGANIKAFDAAFNFGGPKAVLRNVAGGPPEDGVLVVTPVGDGCLNLAFEHDPHNSAPQLIHRRLASLEQMLQRFITAPDTAVDDLGHAHPGGFRASGVPDTARPVLDSDTFAPRFAQRIDAIAHTDPQRIVLTDEADLAEGATQAVTAAELVASVRHLAGHIARATGAGDVVAIEAPRSIAQACAVLACLYAQRTFTVIDPDQASRAEAIRAAANPALTLDTDQIRAYADTELSSAGQQPTPSESTAEQPAYLLFTSGSTGTPKGVRIPNRAFEALLQGHAQTMFADVDRLLGGDRPVVAHTAPFVFDAALDQLSWLFAGARVHLLPAELLVQPTAAAQRMHQLGVTVLDITPSLLAPMLDFGLLRTAASLRAIFCGGEPIPQSLWDGLAEADIAAWNMYGPTETTVDVLAAPITHGPVTVGTALPNVTAAVVDITNRPVDTGEWGELVIGGPQVANGYLGEHPQDNFGVLSTTADSAEPQWVPAYRTGDRVRMVPGRGYEFGGRIDDQLEIRGHRVEPGEVEALLRRVAGVAAAYVAPQDLPGGGVRLVAAVRAEAPTRDRTGFARTVTTELAADAPAWLVPARIIVVDEFPVTHQGKVDRAAISDLVSRQDATGVEENVSERTDNENILAGIIAEVLGTQPAAVPMDLDFIAGGGDSISALQVAAAAGRAGRRLNPVDLLGATPLREIAAELPEAQDPAAQSDTAGEAACAVSPLGRIPAAPRPRGVFATIVADNNEPVQLTGDDGQSWQADIGPAVTRAIASRFSALRAIVPSSVDTPGAVFIPRSPVPPRVTAEEMANFDDTTFGCVYRTVERADDLVDAASSAIDPARGCVFAAAGCPDGIAIAASAEVVDGPAWGVVVAAFGAELRRARSGGTDYNDVDNTPAWRPAAIAQRSTDSLAGAAEPQQNPAPTETETATVPLSAGVIAALHRAPQRGFGVAADLAAVAACRLATEAHVHWWTRPADTDHAIVGALTSRVGLPSLDICEVGDIAAARAALVDTKEFLAAGASNDEPAAAIELVVTNTSLAAAPKGHDADCITIALPHHGPGAVIVHATGADDLADRVAAALSSIAVAAEVAAGATPSDLSVPEVPMSAITEWENTYGPLADVVGLSSLQEGLLYQQISQGAAGGYVVAAGIDLSGPIDPERLRAAFAAVCDRHQILKAAFDPSSPVGPVHIIPREVTIPWRVVDLRHLPRAAAEAGADTIQREFAARDIDLTRAPLLSAALVRFTDTESRLVLGNHHLLTDGWSTPVMLRDMLAYYRGQQPQPAQPTQFADHVAFLNNRDHAADTALWEEILDGVQTGTVLSMTAPPTGEDPITAEALQWPTDAPDPEQVAEAVASMTSGGPEVVLPVPMSVRVAERVTDVAAEHGVTPNSLIQAAWTLAIAGALGTDDVIFGVTLAGRDAEVDGVENAVGMFINTVPMRMRVPADATVGTLIEAAAAAQRQVTGLQHSAITEVEKIGGVGPLFDSIVVYDNFPLASQSGDPDELRITDVATTGRTNLPMSVVVPPGEQFRLGAAYHPELLDGELAIALVQRLGAALTALVNAPHTPVAELLGEPEPVVSGLADGGVTAGAGSGEGDGVAADIDIDDAARTIAEGMQNLLGRDVGLEENFFTIGGDSLGAMRLLGRLRRSLPNLTVMHIVEGGSPQAIAERLSGNGPTELVLPMRGGFGAPLVCIHPAGGATLPFQRLAETLTWPTPVSGIALPSPIPDAENLDELADFYVERFVAELPDGPCRLLGYSFGGMMAQAMAARLQAQGREVDFLGIMDAYPAGRAPKPPEEVQEMVSADRKTVGAVAGLPPEVLAQASAAGIDIEANIRYCGSLMQSAKPQNYQGDVVVLTATKMTPGAPAPESWDPVAAWRKELGAEHVHGYELDFDHGGLVTEQGWAEIVPILAQHRP
ncbi:AMP-binding protein [Corynebacterium sp. TAE3-ERU12]|uniref:condensation domain-containing protein n=1 Tax=Corynebacterium sp. TAE3-ERU12 TaxID=2849491 RepID=UPI001C439E4C|nr:condensation domain-containing protein [Corynebacterium sp. TAE3-ERU12]MBV7294642.1 AMP-binding protein [Corynebacterium sp. TAE3-ERU12]